MNRRQITGIVAAVFVLSLILSSLALAQSGSVFAIRASTVASGGGTSSGGTFLVQGISGQPAAGAVGGGSFTLNNGLWQKSGPFIIYLPNVIR